MATLIERIKKEAEQLTSEELLTLIDEFVHQLLRKQNSTEDKLDLNGLYGTGKGIWQDEDPQEYINRLREDRFL